MSVRNELEQLFAAAGCRGQVCVQPGRGAGEIAFDAAAPAVPAAVTRS